MLTTPQIVALLQDVTYKPGWSVAVYDGRHEGQHCVITTRQVDAYNPESTTDLEVHSPLPPCIDGPAFLDWLAWRLGRIENHEMREWLRVKGHPWSDPHGPDADQDR